jgi:recombination protein RecT
MAENALAKVNDLKTFRELLQNPNVKGRFEEILKAKAAGFMSSILNTVYTNDGLMKVADQNPMSIIRSASVAAALDLPIDKNLGFAWMVPYKGEAQFQMGYKGYVQLALRTSQYTKLNALEVFENQFKSWNALTEEIDADFTVRGTGKVIGDIVYFELINGFKKAKFYFYEDLIAHGKRYSKSFNESYSTWKTHEKEMCLKTGLKQTLSKWGILSIDMQLALKADQAVVKSDDLNNPDAFHYIDGTFEGQTIEGSAKPREASALQLEFQANKENSNGVSTN